MSRYYPICLDLDQKPCLIVGGGEVAERKICTLLEYGAIVRVISPKITEGIALLVEEGKIEYLGREFQDGDLQPTDSGAFFLVIAATDNEPVNQLVAKEARERGILINVVDVPVISSFIVPAIVKRGDLTISVSTGGKSPALARRIRKDLEIEYGPEYEILVDILGNLRQIILRRESDPEKRKEIFKRLAEVEAEEFLEIIRRQGRPEAEKRIKERL